MNDDDLLEAALAQERARQTAEPIDPRWDLVASGQMSEAEARRQLVRGPRDEALLEAFLPLDQSFRRRILARVQRADPVPERSRRRAPRRTWRWRGAVVTAAAAAAALLVVLGTGTPPLPRYEAQLEGGERAMRGSGAAKERVVLRPGSRLDWYLRPETAVGGTVSARTFARGPAGLRPWPSAVEVSPQGAVHVSYALEAGELTPGSWELIVVVGRPERLPASSAALEAVLSAHDATLYVARHDVEVLGAQ